MCITLKEFKMFELVPRNFPAGTELSNHIETHFIGQEHDHELNNETILSQ